MKVPTTAPPALEGEVITKPIGIGDKLRNGATVLAMKPYTPGNARDGLIVLALAHREFVTWVCESDGSEAFWGHYYGMDLVSALAGFEARS